MAVDLYRVEWVTEGVRKTIRGFPIGVRREIGLALRMAQQGLMADFAKPLKGFRGAKVIEIVADDDGDTYRAVYAIQMGDAIWVLHAFQKKSKHGKETPQKEIELIRERLRRAQLLSNLD